MRPRRPRFHQPAIAAGGRRRAFLTGAPRLLTGAPRLLTGAPRLLTGAPRLLTGAHRLLTGAPRLLTGAGRMALQRCFCEKRRVGSCRIPECVRSRTAEAWSQYRPRKGYLVSVANELR